MIERCNFCGETHDTGKGEIFDGRIIKTCPFIPQSIGVLSISAKDWQSGNTPTPPMTYHELGWDKSDDIYALSRKIMLDDKD